MDHVIITRELFLNDPQGRTFADVVNGDHQPFDEVLAFFSDPHRQRRMEESEIHHDRPPLAGVVRELETQPRIDQFLGGRHANRSRRLRQAIGVVVRIVMEQRGWKKTGKKGSLGVRAPKSAVPSAYHNSGGLAFWFLRGERYELEGGMPYRKVRERCEEFDAAAGEKQPAAKAEKNKTRRRKMNAS